MSEEFGPTFITVTDEDGKELVLEFVDALEYNGQMYQAFFPAETEDENEDDPDNGLVILKVIHEDGEDMLSTLDSDEELEAAFYPEEDFYLDENGDPVFYLLENTVALPEAGILLVPISLETLLDEL